ncbi:methylmalonyl-CoA epimerase [candidate division WOR_3 bacterium SM23_60]|uniref:Methylmalonyl-CoA epimerase n=1 Tax=candidate division WOR_3 bacterium SM23_60 TaxID=1703780 RepID=A0A0S8GE89_UNCW3|nr:MAG: methylmalonyl-CoA epimerase [candidate division WOR_3 bacterium SM23_60]
MRLDHIGIAVSSIDEKLKTWQQCFGIELRAIEEVPDQKVRVAVLPVGDVNIELLEPLGDDSTVRKFIDKRGEGVHHLCFKVADIEKVLSDMRAKGIVLIDEKPRFGASGKRIAFIHPKSTGGVLIELTE